MGAVEEWQVRAATDLDEHFDLIFNPRRDHWDSTWIQSIDNPVFKEQVEWELRYIKYSYSVLFHFDPKTKSPITLMELGYCIGLDHNGIFVSCPDGFFRKGNVEIICAMSGITVHNYLEDAIKEVIDFN